MKDSIPLGPTLSRYHQVRFEFDPRRQIVWNVLAKYLQRWVDSEATVLELGAGYGEFSRAIRAARKLALDLNPALPSFWGPGVEPLIQSAREPLPLEDLSIGCVFASNFFEHFTIEECTSILAEVRRVLRIGGRLIAVQPNFRLEPRRYFDDYTHKTAFTDAGFRDFLAASGFQMIHSEPRFMPFTMKSYLPVSAAFVRTYLALPWRPLAGQFLVIAERI